MKIFFKILVGLAVDAAATWFAWHAGMRGRDLLVIFAVMAVTTTACVFWGVSLGHRIDAYGRRVR